uniref:Uncharacterized protein n=1 Tax=Ovis aries TaxID=9940 RepID=A0AC11CYP1_SHEEP
EQRGPDTLTHVRVPALAHPCSHVHAHTSRDTLRPGQERGSPPHTGAWPQGRSPPYHHTLPTAVSAAHGGRVCSTWGDFHYKTFDGDVFRFPGLCNYVFSAHCGSAYEDFNLQLRRGLLGSRPTITHIVLRSQGLVLEVSNGSVLINGWREELPYSRAGLLVERSSAYVKINIRLMLTFMWNGEDSALLELDPKYANQTCGLCGDFNGVCKEGLLSADARLSPLQFGNLQKLDGPTEQCQDPLPSPAADNCTDEEGVCRSTLLGPAFAPCHGLVDAEVYVAACTQDLCRCPTCPCATFAEYSRQCAHAGGQPQNWRGPDLCPQTCPLNTRHQECGSPCVDTCSNPERSQLCEDHCVDGCFCPPDTVLDDVTHTGCLPLRQCPCTRGGRIYAPGASFNTSCSSCTCSGGLWQCQDLPCPGTCSVQGGSHISTYDEKLYDVHGDCSYVLTKVCADSALTVLADLRKCGLTDNENCLKTVTLSLNGGDTIQANGGVFVNSIYTQLPVSVADVTVFRPSSFFILVQTGPWLQLQVQLAPLMQVFLRLDPAYRGRMCGLCGNFNQNQADDFRTVGGVVEATAAAFANTWKTQAACPNVKNSFEDPCSLSVENENYARHWCSLLTRPAGPFSPCHSVVSPGPFHSNCLFDTCNCEKSEDCMCAALSSYVWACAARGVLLRGWRDGVCTKYASSCPKTQSYAHVVDSCQPTCRSLSQPDVSCDVAFVPVDGCVCPQGTFLDDAGDCVPAEACPCYLGGTVVAPGEVVHDSGVVCSCVSGRLSCLGATEQRCVAPMVFLDCSNASADAPGAECVRSCHTLDVDCFSTHCVSGCVCPVGLLSDGSGGCVAKEDCPCVHNEAAYKPGQVIKVDCNTCTCRGRRWECSDRPCLGTCVAYGDGHFLTFDGERYGFEGSCEYTLAQDYCVGGDTANGTFRIVTENVPCGTTGVTCSKAIKIFLGSYELILHEGTHRVLQRGPGGDLPYRVRYMGVYLTVETHSGVVVSWDRKTSVIIRLRHEYKGRVCGLCGNFDDNALNDFTTRSQSVVGDVLEFGNSWKFSPSCPDALAPRDPCTANPYRRSWAQKQCSIINSATFSACRSQVDSTRYYEACVSDACACDSGADCECFCTAVAAYAQACHEAGVCVSWRTPDVCPLFCDYYNPHGECEWHYQPCGVPCLKTCRNPSGLCLMDLPGLEGCYPECPPSKPLFNEDRMECVAQCSGCYDRDGNYYDVGTRVPTTENCQSCACTSSGLQCTHSPEACTCTYEGRTYAYGDVIYNTTDGLGACLIAICRDNGTIVRRAMECPGTPSITPFTFTSTAAPPSTTGEPVSPPLGMAGKDADEADGDPCPLPTGLVPTPSTVCVRKACQWSDWYDGGRPEPGVSGGDFETFENLRQRGYQVCLAPVDIECQAQLFPGMPLEKLAQKVECSQDKGLTCLNSEQSPPLCHNYKLRVLCCDYVPCGTSQPPSSQTTPTRPPTHPTTAVLTSQTGPTSVLATTQTSTAGSQPEAPLSTTGTPSTQHPRTSTPVPATATTGPTTSQATTSCQPECTWTEWFDVDYPKYEEGGGDFETYEKIRAAGGAVCEQPQEIKCEAENYPGLRVEQVGQRVHCDVRFGLVCRNEEQLGLFKMCINYRVSVLCCSSRCTLTTAPTSPTATATATVPTTSTPVPATATTGPTTSQATTSCQPKCTWTEWFDVDFPTSGVTGGDIETYANIRAAAGGAICEQPLKLECRAEPLPDTPLTDLGQVVLCQREVGLVCRNQDQSGQMCFNYQIRLLCCEKSYCPSTAITTSTPTPTSETGPASTVTTERVSTPTTVTGPVSTVTTERVSTPTSETGPSSTVTTERVSTPTSETGPASTVTTERVSKPTSTGPASTVTTEKTSIHTSVTGPTSTVTTERVSTPTSETGPTSIATTETVSTPTSVTGPSSIATTETVSTPTSVTGPSSTVTTERTPTPTSVTGPSSTVTTERTPTPTSVTGPSSIATTERVSTIISVTGPSSTVTTERVSTPTSVTGPASTVTMERVSTFTSETGPASTVTTERVSTFTSETGPASTVTTEKTSIHTSVTGPASTVTTERVSTPTSVTGPASTVTTEKTSIHTSVTGPASTVTMERVSTPTSVTGPSSTVTTERIPTPTSVTGPSSTVITEGVSTITSVTGPSSTVTTERTPTPTSVTGPSSIATTERVSTITSVTGPSSTVTTEGVSTPTSVTGPSSTATTKRTPTPTSVTGPTSTVTTERVSTFTSETGPASTVTTEKTSIHTSVTGPTSTVTTERVSTPTSVTGPSSTVITEGVSTLTSVTGPSSTVTTERTPTPTSVTGPSSTGVSTLTSETGPSSTVTTEGVSTPTSVIGPSSKGTTKRTPTPTSVTGPSSVATTKRTSTPTSVTGPSSMGTTERMSISSPSPFPGSSPLTTKPDLSSISTSPLLTTPVSPLTTPSWSSETSGSLMPSVVPATSPSPTTPCLCHAFGKFFLPGDVVYNKTDGAGCPFLAICNQRCELDRFQGACTTSSPTGTSASVPPTTPVSGCDRTIPPRKVCLPLHQDLPGPSVCTGPGHLSRLLAQPQPSVATPRPSAPAGVCSAWGSSHYETFDGASYTFRDNCTYVLVREIQPRHGNFRVLLHNRFCEAAAHCPRALSTHYQSTDVVLSTTTSVGICSSGFSKNGVAVTLTGATGMRVDIPAIGVSITFNGRVFQARLSYSHFSHNTEGQCGTCTNNRRDECRRPDGTMARTCRDMARSWLVSDSSGEGCGEPTGLPPTTSPLLPGTSTPAIHPSCPPEPLCELMLSSVFAGCHSLIPPGPYFNACVSDSCWPGHGRKVLCQSLETYAELCRSRGVCADWRNATHGLCGESGVAAGGPGLLGLPDTCLRQSLQSVGLAEGCFCPDGHILFNSHRDICVPECCKQPAAGPPQPWRAGGAPGRADPGWGQSCPVLPAAQHGPCACRYSMETQARQCSCSCCQETRTHQEAVTMQCPDGTAFQHTYTHVDECGCVPACASSPQTLEESASTFPTLGSTAV